MNRSWLTAWCLALGAAAAGAAPVRIFTTATAAALEKGTLDDVAVSDEGVLELARRATRLAELQEPFAFTLAALPGGAWAVGTGNEGRLLRVAADGAVEVLFDAAEPVVFALWADPDGTLFAGTSPRGKVYRIRGGGEAEEYFDPGEVYIWALARGDDGALWVATGTDGHLYRVEGERRGRLALDAEGTHVRSLLPLAGGDLLIGTAPNGTVLRWSAGGQRARTLYDSALDEVVALAPDGAGGAWAAVLASEASLIDVVPPRAPVAPAPEATATPDAPGEPQGVVEVIEGDGSQVPAATAGPRAAGGPRSELVHLMADGRVEPVWSSEEETVFALLAEGARVWAGTGLEGALYRFEAGRPAVEKDLEERQIVGLAGGAGGPVLLTSNAAALWRLGSGAEARGTYTSPALDAGQAARFGVFRWRGEEPAGSSVRVSFRTGFAAEPDATWSPWTNPAAGRELSLAELPPGRYLQYRLELRGEPRGPRVSATEVSYRQHNLPPRIERLSVLDPGQVLVPSGFNPGEQVFEPASPSREGIFTVLTPALPRDERLKTLWRKGWRTLRWQAADPNGDELVYRLEARPEADPDGWLEVRDEIAEDHLGFDAAVLPDGVYRFRLTASDERGNDPGERRSAIEISEPVIVDHTPPELRSARRAGAGARLSVYDAASPLREARLSIDGGEWRPLAAADGLVDGQSEELIVSEIPTAARLVLLRVSDAAFNDRTFDLGKELAR